MENKVARNILLTTIHPQNEEEAEAIGVAIKAIERMIPKKPKTVAEYIEERKAKELPRKTGLFFLVKN